MRIASINMTERGSTGTIMLQISEAARARGHRAISFSTLTYSMHERPIPADIPDHFYYGSYLENTLHFFFGALLGRNGFHSYFGTRRLIKELKKYKPDILHLHNLHKFCIHLPSLFRYIKKSGVPTVWTLHDCWSFTGQCPHFDMIGCDQWKTECRRCPQLPVYPKTVRNNARSLFRRKRKLFSGVEHLTVVTPSEWLRNLVKASFLRQYPTLVINNGIDLSSFRPTESSFRRENGCESAHMILGVAMGWTAQKGIDVFIELAKRLPPEYRIVLVGTSREVEASLPPEILCIRKTHNVGELAQIYSAADLLLNPTREETFPTVNIEALACGTPVLTFRTGGSPEIIDESCGSVVEKNDVDRLEKEILRICSTHPYSAAACVARAAGFEKKQKFAQYIDLYEKIHAQR